MLKFFCEPSKWSRKPVIGDRCPKRTLLICPSSTFYLKKKNLTFYQIKFCFWTMKDWRKLTFFVGSKNKQNKLRVLILINQAHKNQKFGVLFLTYSCFLVFGLTRCQRYKAREPRINRGIYVYTTRTVLYSRNKRAFSWFMIIIYARCVNIL